MRVVDELRVAQLCRHLEIGENGVGARHLVEGDVEGIEEMPARRRERAELARIGHEQSVERVDADEIGAGAGADLGETGEILEIAHAPVARRAQAVDLAGDAPAAAVAQPLGHVAGDAFRRRHRPGIAGLDLRQALGDGLIVAGGDAQRLEGGAERCIGRGDDRAHEGDEAALDAGTLGQAVEVIAHFAGFLLFRITVSPASMIRVRPSSWKTWSLG